MIKFKEDELINNTTLLKEDNYITNIHMILEKQYVDTTDVEVKDFQEYSKEQKLPEGTTIKSFIKDCPPYELKPLEENNKECCIFTANGTRIALGKSYYKRLSKIPHIKFYSDGGQYNPVYLVIHAGLMKKVIGCLMPCAQA